jgi:hypothetical protein
VEEVGGVAQPGVHRGGVADQPDGAAPQRPAPGRQEDLEPAADAAASGPAGA